MQNKKYSPSFKKKLVKEVKDGASLRATSIKHKIPIATLRLWCEKKGVKSVYSREITSEKEIINTIKEKKAVRVKDLLEEFDLSSAASLNRRLRQLILNKKIKEILFTGKTKNVGNLKHYMNCRVFYICKEDLKQWILNQLPKQLPAGMRKAITHKFKQANIALEIPHKKPSKYISISEKRYNILRAEAKKEGKTIKEYIEAKYD